MKKWLYPLAHVLVWSWLIFRDVYSHLIDYASSDYMLRCISSSGLSPVFYFIVFCTSFALVEMAAFYSACYWIAPNLYPRPRWIRAILAVISAFTVTVLTRYLVEYHIHKSFLHFDNYFGRPFNLGFYIPNCLLYVQEYFLYGICFFFLVQSYRVRDEKRQAELAFLKSQTNPHFLFNTINDIYALTYQKSDEAPEALLKLSDMLRYSLYDGAADHGPLKRELDYLQDYLDLHRLGAKQKSFIQFNVEGDPGNLQIAPLLLVPFVENIIKHGVTDDSSRPAEIKVRIDRKTLYLDAVNEVKDQQKDRTGGIGLASVRRRLELLYPNRHRFVIRQENGTFHCQMEIQL